TRGVIRYAVAAFLRSYFCAENVGVFQVVLVGSELFRSWFDGELAAFLPVHERPEDKAAVKAWPAKPFNISVFVDKSQIRAIADQAHVIGMFCHTVSFLNRRCPPDYLK